MGAIIDKIKGKAKQLEGRLTGDKLRVAQGRAETAKGDLESAAARAARKMKGFVDRTATRAKAGIDRASRRTRTR